MKSSKGFFSGSNWSFQRRFLFFGHNSSIAGMKHVFKENGNELVKLFWLLVIIISAGCLYLLILSAIRLGNLITFTPDTLYLGWNTIFPAVTVCQTYNGKLGQREFSDKYPDLAGPLNFDLRRYLSDLLFARGTCSRSLCVPCGDQIPCDVPWRDMVENLHKSCEEMITNCTFHGVEMPCCKYFHPVDSEHGPCYSFNTLQKRGRTSSLITVNRTTGPGDLSFRLHLDAQVSVHSSEELATNNLGDKLKFFIKTKTENHVEFLISVVEIYNDPSLQFEDIEVRGCRYLHEIPDGDLHTYPVYSYGACRLARMTEHSYRQCHCIHPARDTSYRSKYCNYTGLNCLVNYEAEKAKADKEGYLLKEDCLPSCDESELTNIHIFRRWIPEKRGKGTVVNMRMASLPTLRFERNLLRTDLDLVVSLAGLLGLFFSASILSVVEVFYLFFRAR